MTIRIVKGTPPSPIGHLVVDYLASCQARGLVPRSLKQYAYALEAVFLPWCEREGITDIGQLDRRAVDRFTSELLSRTTAAGQPLSKHSVATYIRPVQLLLTWASREGEEVKARPQLPRRERPVRDILSRGEIDQLEHAMTHERDRLIIRVFGDCGLRLEELSRLTAGDLILGSRKAHLRVHGKRDRIRDVPVPPTLLRRIERLIARRPEERSSDAIFLTHRRGRLGEYDALSKEGVYQVVKEAVARARISKRVYPHLLRHSFMTEMLRRDMNVVQLSFIAGASPEVIAQHYAHLTKDDAYEAMIRALTPRSPH